MGYVIDFTDAGYGECASQSSIESIQQGLAFKMRFDGDLLNEMSNYEADYWIEIGDGTASGRKCRIWVYKDQDMSRWQINVKWNQDYYHRNVYVPFGSPLSSGTYYILYSHYDDSASPDQYEALYESNGTLIDDDSQVMTGGNLPSGSGKGKVAIAALIGGSDGGSGHWDGLAIYNNVLSGSDRYSEPQNTDTGIVAYWPHSDGSGSTSTNDVSGGQNLALSGYTWESGGIWDSGEATPPDPFVTVEIRAP